MFYQYKKLQKKEQHNQEKRKKTVADLYKDGDDGIGRQDKGKGATSATSGKHSNKR
jgi:hypothetical protein